MIVIRQYREEDREDVWQLHNAALLAINAHAGNGAWDDDLHHIEDEYLVSGGDFFVGLLAGQVVAMGALKRVSETRAEIKRMRVMPGYQRRGFGQAVLDRLETRARELGFTHLFLETTARQKAAQGLYRKNGYQEKSRRQQDQFEVILFAKDLPLRGPDGCQEDDGKSHNKDGHRLDDPQRH